MVTELVFCSALDASYREELEELLFFDPNQQKAFALVSEAIRRYGKPRIVDGDRRLGVALDSAVEMQTLFVLEGRRPNAPLVGAIGYTRESRSTLAVVFAAVRADYAGRGAKAAEFLLVRMIDQLREIGRRIRGIESLNLITAGGKVRQIRIG